MHRSANKAAWPELSWSGCSGMASGKPPGKPASQLNESQLGTVALSPLYQPTVSLHTNTRCMGQAGDPRRKQPQ